MRLGINIESEGALHYDLHNRRTLRWTKGFGLCRCLSGRLYLHPDECIDCAACEPVCPVTAIFAEDAVPAQWTEYIEKNYEYFKNVDPSELKRK